jgi:hypothetical protein
MSKPGTELIKTSDSNALVAQESVETCANCGTPLAGPFCSACGQRVEHHVHSLPEFLGEAAEVITHADSRVWRTFVPLFFRPGFLTQQYLAGRRASYLPPFRLYIVLSVVFFLMVSLATRPARESYLAAAKVPGADATTHVDRTKAALTEAQKEIDADADPEEQAMARKTLQSVVALNAKASELKSNPHCESAIPTGWLRGWVRERAVAACEKAVADNAKELLQSMIHNAGRAMFVFLPLIAALMKLLYRHPRRYYVEHLLLLLHNHAFIFASLSLLMCLQLLVSSEKVQGWMSTALWLYILWYLYRSMRRVYAQGRARTALKFSVLAIAYFFCGVLTFTMAAIYSAFTL